MGHEAHSQNKNTHHATSISGQHKCAAVTSAFSSFPPSRAAHTRDSQQLIEHDLVRLYRQTEIDIYVFFSKKKGTSTPPKQYAKRDAIWNGMHGSCEPENAGLSASSWYRYGIWAKQLQIRRAYGILLIERKLRKEDTKSVTRGDGKKVWRMLCSRNSFYSRKVLRWGQSPQDSVEVQGGSKDVASLSAFQHPWHRLGRQPLLWCSLNTHSLQGTFLQPPSLKKWQ
eukprot:2657738-Amphidinium_carterae.1